MADIDSDTEIIDFIAYLLLATRENVKESQHNVVSVDKFVISV